ncbi:hypothetical protein ACMZ6Z_05610 [Streptococcus pluranimalium]|uniref:hypothetical protein n=1 Tax=Streptococcus pluranimalium TaxID=82348 RepID=UPI0039FCC863
MIDLLNKLFKNNQLVGRIKSGNEEYTLEDLETVPERVDSVVSQVIDIREKIAVDNFIEGGRYYKLLIEDSDIKKNQLYQEVVKQLRKENISSFDEGMNNKKISISKNYIKDSNRKKYPKGAQWSGWHSLFEEKFDSANNFKHYIFCVRGNKDFYALVFTKENLEKFLKAKVVDGAGKYNFYFTGFDIDGKNHT